MVSSPRDTPHTFEDLPDNRVTKASPLSLKPPVADTYPMSHKLFGVTVMILLVAGCAAISVDPTTTTTGAPDPESTTTLESTTTTNRPQGSETLVTAAPQPCDGSTRYTGATKAPPSSPST